jgi:hypothetical protein
VTVTSKAAVAFGYLQEWEKIESFALYLDESVLVLKMKHKTRLPVFLRYSALSIPSNEKVRIHSVLILHLPSKALRRKVPNKACTRLVGVCAFSSGFRGLELVASNWRYLVPPTSG